MVRLSRRLRAQILPRGLDRVEAASYIGIGTELFDRGVAAGVLPKPRQIFTRLVWDIEELDRAFEAIPHRGEVAPTSPDDKNAAPSERDRWLQSVQ